MITFNMTHKNDTDMLKLSMLFNKKFIGSIEAYFMEGEPHITGSYIVEKSRRQGYSKELYKKIFKILKLIGHKHVCSDTIITSDIVHNIWKKYEAVWTGKKYRLKL